MIRIKLTNVYVDDQAKTLAFFTDVLRFVKKTDIPTGAYTAGQEPTQQSFEPTAADVALMERSGGAWAAALEAAGRSGSGS